MSESLLFLGLRRLVRDIRFLEGGFGNDSITSEFLRVKKPLVGEVNIEAFELLNWNVVSIVEGLERF